MRYPHILNHSSTYVIPSIDEVLNLYQETPWSRNPASDPELIYPTEGGSDLRPLHQGEGCTHEQSRNYIAASIANSHEGTDAPEVIGPGSQLYNLRYAFPSKLSPEKGSNGAEPSSSSDFSGAPVIYYDSWGYTPSVSESEDTVYLSTIPEEAEPPEIEADVETVKPAFEENRQRVEAAHKRNAKGRKEGKSGLF